MLKARALAHGALRFAEAVRPAQAAVLQEPLLAGGIDCCDAGLAEIGVGRRSFAVDELRAELHRNLEARHAPRPAAAADALARLEDEHGAAGASQLVGRGEAGGTGADDDYVVGRRLIPL